MVTDQTTSRRQQLIRCQSDDNTFLMSVFTLLSKHNIPAVLSLSDDEDCDTDGPAGAPLFTIDKAPAPAAATRRSSGTAGKDPVKREKRQLLLAGASASRLVSASTSAAQIFHQKAVTCDPSFLSQTGIGRVVGQRLGRRQRREESDKTAGGKWFHMPATEVDDVVRRDVSLVNMRDAMSANRFYKRNSGIRELKYFEVGTVVRSAADFHTDLTRRMRKRTLAEELAADADTRAWHKRKYKQVLATDPYYLKQERRRQAKRAKEKRQAKETAAGHSMHHNSSTHYPGRRQQEKQNVFRNKKK